jgi:tetratricopeptide (TPR) repeat protein
MRLKFLFFLLLPCVFLVNAQEVTECDETADAISKLITDSKFDEAYQQWTLAQKCTKPEALYILGEKILQYKIESPATDEEKHEYILSLANLYDRYEKNIPLNKNRNLVKKAMLLYGHNAATPDETLALLDRAFHNDRKNFIDAQSLSVYFDLYYKKFLSSNKSITEGDVFIRQDEVILRLAELASETPSQAADAKTVSGGIRALVSSFATCDKLDSFYEKSLTENKADTLWLEGAAATLMAKNCTAGHVFRDIAGALYKIKPSSKSAYNVAIASLRSASLKKAIEYFDISAGLAADPAEKANTLYMAATSLATSNPQQSREYLRKAVIAQPAFGKAYLLEAQLYANAESCGKTPFEKKAVYILAAQTVRKAGIDPYLKVTANNQAGIYLKKGPSKSEIKSAKKAGKKVAFACWINESVVIPE